jgi:hypothetical protein
MEALHRQEGMGVIAAQIEKARRVAPPSLTLPHKGGGNGKLSGKGHAIFQHAIFQDEIVQGHDAPPIRNSRAAIPNGACVAAKISPPRER